MDRSNNNNNNNNHHNDLFLQSLGAEPQASAASAVVVEPPKTKKQKKHDRCIFQSVQFALAIVRNPFAASPHYGKWLAVNETNGRGWWVPGGCVERGETFEQTCHRECLEEANMRIQIKGILKVDHSVSGDVCRMRVIYYCEPTSLNEANNYKTMPDSESLEARWVSINDLLLLATGNPGLRGRELLNWATYLENNGHIMPLEMFGEEGDLQPLGSRSAPLTAPQQSQQQRHQLGQQQQQQQRHQQRQASQLQQQQQQQQTQQRQLQQLQSQLMQPTPLQPKALDNDSLFLQQLGEQQQSFENHHHHLDAGGNNNNGNNNNMTTIHPQQKEFMEWANAKRKELKYEAV